MQLYKAVKGSTVINPHNKSINDAQSIKINTNNDKNDD